MRRAAFTFGIFIGLSALGLSALSSSARGQSAAELTQAAPAARDGEARDGAPGQERARAAEGGAQAAYARAARALEAGAFDRALDELEALADQGFIHPDASFNRGVAYLRRAESGQARPGDYGRAAAALSEVLLLRPSDTEAARTLAQVESQIARRRSREGRDPVIASPSMARALVSLADENVWAGLALAASLITTVGLGLWLWGKQPRQRFTGGVTTAVATATLLATSGLALSARHYRTTSTPAVVVVVEARLLDELGKPLGRDAEHQLDALPEGAFVWITERGGALCAVEWGTVRGFVRTAELQALASAQDLTDAP